MECHTSTAGSLPVPGQMGYTDGGGRKVRRMWQRDKIHSMDHDKKS